jgi:hypothetical protein
MAAVLRVVLFVFLMTRVLPVVLSLRFFLPSCVYYCGCSSLFPVMFCLLRPRVPPVASPCYVLSVATEGSSSCVSYDLFAFLPAVLCVLL